MRERYVLLGLARARAGWFRMVGQWATAAVLPADFLRCVSVQELRARLRSGRAFSAILIDGRVPGLDRDLIAEAAEVGVSVLVVDGDPARDWRELGAAAVLAESFSRDELVEVLQATSTAVGTADLDPILPAEQRPAAHGELVAVCGPGGTGASTVAVALAQGLAAGEGWAPVGGNGGGGAPGARRTSVHGSRRALTVAPTVLLADLCRVADQALLHDARVLVPSIQEVVEAHRTSVAPRHVLLEQTFEVPARGYRLLLGLRRPQHWVSLRPRAVETTLDALQSLVDVVVADVEADVEGEAETGSTDIEDRNLLARATLARAEVVLVVGTPSMKGLAALVRTIGDLLAFGIPAERLLPVVNRAPRSPRARAELTAAVAKISRSNLDSGVGVAAPTLANPLFLPDRNVDDALRDGVALPAGMARSLARGVAATRRRADRPLAVRRPEPVAIAPGSLRGFTAQEEPGS
jgi:hypothetical protein